MEAGWLRGAADLLDRGTPIRTTTRERAMWLEELAPEARAHVTSLRSAWVEAAEALRSAVHAHESERGPLVEAIFPVWRAPALRRHADQAQAAETELRRRLASAYVARRLAEPPTQAALRSALEALEAAGAAWDAGRDRAALGGAEADEARSELLARAEETARTLDRVRWVVRAALVAHPELTEVVFPRRSRVGDPEPATGADSRPADTLAPAADSPEAAEPSPVARHADLVEAAPERSDRAVADGVNTDKGAGEPTARRRKGSARSTEPTGKPSRGARARRGSRATTKTPPGRLRADQGERPGKPSAKPAPHPAAARSAVSNEPQARRRAAPSDSSSGDASIGARPAGRKKPTRSAATALHPRPGRGGARS